jgi:hypothetical protein
MRFDPTTPYNDLPLLPPAADIETKAVLRRDTEWLLGKKRVQDSVLVAHVVLQTGASFGHLAHRGIRIVATAKGNLGGASTWAEKAARRTN